MSIHFSMYLFQNNEKLIFTYAFTFVGIPIENSVHACCGVLEEKNWKKINK